MWLLTPAGCSISLALTAPTRISPVASSGAGESLTRVASVDASGVSKHCAYVVFGNASRALASGYVASEPAFARRVDSCRVATGVSPSLANSSASPSPGSSVSMSGMSLYVIISVRFSEHVQFYDLLENSLRAVSFGDVQRCTLVLGLRARLLASRFGARIPYVLQLSMFER